MKLIINNKLIDTPILTILNDIRKASGYKYFATTKEESNGYVMVQCPFHKDGHESHPSCGIYVDDSNSDIAPGFFHCFTCHEAGPFEKLVAYCLNITEEEAKEWLSENYSNTFVEYYDLPSDIEIDKRTEDKPAYLDESELDKYNYFHPYMYQRKLTDDVLAKFKIGFDVNTDSITFPMWDENGHLVAINRRSVTRKKYDLQANKSKPVYLLNYIKKENIHTVYVVESQINALTLWSWGYPAIALCGTGSINQYEILKRCGIYNYILCFDGDDAGHKGEKRFIQNMNDDVICSCKVIPKGKDVNDLTKQEFDALPLV